MSHRERCMTGVFNKILGHLGFLKGTPPSSSSPQASASASASLSASRCCGAAAAEHKAQENAPSHAQKLNVFINKDAVASVKPPAGFRVRVSVPAFIEPFAPVVIECTPGSGGVQGLQWYSEKLMMDEDGDVAQEFLDEVVSQASAPFPGYTRVLPSFKTKMKTRPAKLKGPVCTFDGNVVQSIESSTCVRRS